MSKQQMNAAEMGAKGGKTRAARLTPEQRSEMARRAVEARWEKAGKPPGAIKATHEGTLEINGITIPCAVLMDGTRVISQRGMSTALGRAAQGSGSRESDKNKPKTGDAKLPTFLAANNLKTFIDIDLAASLTSPIKYIPLHGGRTAHGFKAELVPRICEVWLKANDAAALSEAQLATAKVADILVRGLAHVGIIALVDEATGFEDARPARALTAILEQFVREEIRRYVSAFPLAYFRELCRLRGAVFSESMRLPKYFGHLTNDLIYSRLAPGVIAELKRKNPVVNGRRKDKNYWWLTEGVGHPALLRLLGSVVTLMKLSETWEDLKIKVDRIHPPFQPLPPLLKGLDGFDNEEPG